MATNPPNANIGPVQVSGGLAQTAYTIPSDVSTGDFYLHGTYNQNEHYKQATDTADFKIRLATNITVNDVLGNHGESSTFTATVKYDTTNNVNEGQVRFTLGSTVIGTANVSNGVATLDYTIPDEVADGTAITANYLGTSTYGASATSTSGTLSIRSEDLILEVEPLHSSINRGETLEILISAIENNPPDYDEVTNGSISLYVDNTLIQSNITYDSQEEGYFHTYTIPSNMTSGQHTLRAVFAQTSEYTETTATNTFIVRNPTHIVVSNTSGNAGQSATLLATIYDENDTIVTTGQAQFKQNGSLIDNGTVSVGNNGTASKSVTVPSGATEGSTITYTVEYVENDNYTAASATNITITVRKTPVIVVQNVTGNRGDTVYLTAGVTYGGHTVSEGNVTFTISTTSGGGVTPVVPN